MRCLCGLDMELVRGGEDETYCLSCGRYHDLTTGEWTEPTERTRLKEILGQALFTLAALPILALAYTAYRMAEGRERRRST